jgi:hypothetical protein
VLASLALLSAMAFQAAPLQAQVVSGTSTGYALFADVDALGVITVINQPETPFLTNSAPVPYNNSASIANPKYPSPCGALFQPACALDASLLFSNIDSDVNGAAGSKSAHGQGGVVGLDLLGVLGPLLGNVTIQSDSTVSGDSGALIPTGSTTILGLTLLGTALDHPLNNVAPNTDLFSLLGLGSILGISAIVNEQIVTGDCIIMCMQETNALHITLANGLVGGTLLSGEIILGHSEAKLTATAPVPVPAAIWLLGSGVLGLAAVARRKKSLIA